MTIRNLVFFGDSTTQGSISSSLRQQGGTGAFTERYASMYAKWLGLPILGYGFRGLWLRSGTSLIEYTTSGSWTTTASSDAFDKAPFGYALYNSSGGTLTWTRPIEVPAAGGFAIYWIDKTSTGNWQYRVDGGAWTNMGQSPSGSNGLKKFYVSTAVSQTVDIRANDGSSDVVCCIAGVEPYRLNPNSNSGVIVHNLGYDGNFLSSLVGSVSGDRLAWLDSVTLGANTVSNSPNELYVMFTNDILTSSTGTFNTNLVTLLTRANFARRCVIAPFEQYGNAITSLGLTSGSANITGNTFNSVGDPTIGIAGTSIQGSTTISSVTDTGHAVMSKTASGNVSGGTAQIGRSTTTQSSFRTQASTTATAQGVKFVNIYSLWSATWGAGWLSANTVALMSDNLHESAAGNAEIAMRLWWAVGPRIVS